MAKLHNHSQQWTPPLGFDRPTYDAEGFIGTSSSYPLDQIGRKHLSSTILRDLETVYSRLKDVEQELGRSRQFFGLIHVDLSFSNIVFTAQEAMPIDFDECGFGFYLLDLATALAGPWGKLGYLERYEMFLNGYRESRRLSDDFLVHLPVFMAVRTTAMLLWAAAQSPDHPWVEGMWQRVRSMLLLT